MSTLELDIYKSDSLQLSMKCQSLVVVFDRGVAYSTLRSSWKNLPVQLNGSTLQEENKHANNPRQSEQTCCDLNGKQFLHSRCQPSVVDQLHIVNCNLILTEARDPQYKLS